MPTPHPDLEKQLASIESAVARRLDAVGVDRDRFRIANALAEVFDGHMFLELRLGENRSASARAGRLSGGGSGTGTD